MSLFPECDCAIPSVELVIEGVAAVTVATATVDAATPLMITVACRAPAFASETWLNIIANLLGDNSTARSTDATI